MSEQHDNDAGLERAIAEMLRRQPLRRAPAGLEERVLAELERRAARAWWRRSFTSWPLAARVAFLLACAAVARLVLAGVARIGQLASEPLERVEAVGSTFTRLLNAGSSILEAIPPLWLYGGALLAVVLYGLLFGLAAAAYRILYLSK